MIWECPGQVNELGKMIKKILLLVIRHTIVEVQESTDNLARKKRLGDNLQEIKQAKTFLETYNLKRAIECINLNKNNILKGILPDHCKLNENLNRLGVAKQFECMSFCWKHRMNHPSISSQTIKLCKIMKLKGVAFIDMWNRRRIYLTCEAFTCSTLLKRNSCKVARILDTITLVFQIVVCCYLTYI